MFPPLHPITRENSNKGNLTKQYHKQTNNYDPKVSIDTLLERRLITNRPQEGTIKQGGAGIMTAIQSRSNRTGHRHRKGGTLLPDSRCAVPIYYSSSSYPVVLRTNEMVIDDDNRDFGRVLKRSHLA